MINLALPAEVAQIVLAGFAAGVKAEAKRQAVQAGKELVREAGPALIQTESDIRQAMMFVEDTAVMASGAALKATRKPSAYNKRYARAYKALKKKKTLKSGKMAKGFTGKRGHAKLVKLAHAAAKKGGRKR